MTASRTRTSWRPQLERLEDRCTPSCVTDVCPPALTMAPLGGGHAQVALLLGTDSLAAQLPNGTIHLFPPTPLRGLLTAAYPPSPVMPTSFAGALGGGHSQVLLQISEGTANVLRPGGMVAVPPNPCIGGLVTAALAGGSTGTIT